MEAPVDDPTPVFDSLDIDLLVKVLAHTAFSEWHAIPDIRRANSQV